MGIVSVTEIPTGNGGNEDKNGILTDVRVHHVKVSLKTERAAFIRANAAIPARFSVHPDDSRMICKTQSIKRTSKSSYLWAVVSNYSSEIETTEDEEEENPLNEPLKWTYSSKTVMVPAIKDKNGVAILNSAGQQYDEPVMVEKTLFVHKVVYNVATPTNTTPYSGRCNSTAFAGFSARTMKIGKFNGSNKRTKNGIEYYTETVEFVEDPDGWNHELLQAGVQELVGGELVKILDKNKQPITEPVPLNVLGGRIPPGDLPGAAVYKEWQIMPEADFNILVSGA